MNEPFIEITSNGGRIGHLAWNNSSRFLFGSVYWSCWPWSFAIERTIVDAKPRKLRAEYTLTIDRGFSYCPYVPEIFTDGLKTGTVTEVLGDLQDRLKESE